MRSLATTAVLVAFATCFAASPPQALAAQAAAPAAEDPVAWRQWGEQAVDEARIAGRPLLLVIGDSWSRPCMLMDRTALRDPEAAALMSEHFVPVRIDLAQRPDLGAIYTAGLRAIARRVGWPLVAFVDPATLRPFDGGTSYDAEAFRRLLAQAHSAWTGDRSSTAGLCDRAALGIATGLGRPDPEPQALGPDLVRRAAAQLMAGFDRRCGGFRRSRPREPRPTELRLLMETAWSDSSTRIALLFTLDHLGTGAIYDQLGGGFHVAADDQCWALPRFEKTLALNAQLASVYATAHERTGDPFYADRAAGALDWALRELGDPGGAFRAATAAEAGSRDGGTYVWAPGEAETALTASGLGPDDSAFANKIYGLEQPLFRDPDRPGDALLMIPRLAGRPDDAAGRLGLGAAEFEQWKSRIDAALRSHRAGRPRPAVDEQVIAGWNGLVIAALVDGAHALGQATYLDAARRAARATLTALRREDGSLARSFRGGRAEGEGLLEDYALLIFGLLALEQATGDPGWLEHAIALEAAARDRFRDVATGGMFDSPGGGPALPLRLALTEDGALPAADGVMLGNLLDLHERTGDERYLDDAVALVSAVSGAMNRNPAGTAAATIALDRLLREHPQRLLGPPDAAIPANPVTLSASAAVVRVAREHPGRVELALDIAPGCRVVAHDPGAPGAGEDAGLLVELAGRGVLLEASYPQGEPGCAAGGAALFTHAGRVVIPLLLRRPDGAPAAAPGTRPRLVLRYQACTDALRPPPRRLLVPIEIELE